jgi:hypothetical protein
VDLTNRLTQWLTKIVLAIINASMDGKRSDAGMGASVLGRHIQQANKICVSMWPILFGAIVAQSLRIWAAYKVEKKGIELMVSASSPRTYVNTP